MVATVVETIRNTDDGLKELRLTENPEDYCADFSDLIDALQGNSTIEYVRMDRDFLPGMNSDDMFTLLDTMGKLPMLKEIHILHAILSASAFENFLQQAENVEHIELGSVDIQGSPEDHECMRAAIASHKKLKSFMMLDFSVGIDGTINEIIHSLAQVPTLQVVKLDVAHQRRRSIVGSEAAAIKPDSNIGSQALASLVRNALLLEELHLNRMTLQCNSFQDLALAIQEAPKLHTLGLTSCGLTDADCNQLATALAANCNLETLDLSCNKLSDEGCTLLASALTDNRHVKLLRLWGNMKISNAGFDALVDMLEHNCVLERLPLMAPSEYSTKIEAKLYQNRSLAA